jgi:hypothetical protein
MINVNDSAAKVNDGVIGPGRRAAAPVCMIAAACNSCESSNGEEVLLNKEID